jgi:hypothetical protein
MKRTVRAWGTVGLLASTVACDKPAPVETVASASATATAIVSAPPPPPPKPVVKKPSHPCPKGSTGDGTFKKPCEGEGSTRMMDVKWTGKMRAKGPKFKVTSKSDLEILYGSIVVYFYDKAGKQLMAGDDEKKRGYRTCAGKNFAGPMKPKEKAFLYFSCAKKKHVPEGTVAIEAELKMVGFTAKDDKKADTFWRNKHLVPAKRPKGGIK